MGPGKLNVIYIYFFFLDEETVADSLSSLLKVLSV